MHPYASNLLFVLRYGEHVRKKGALQIVLLIWAFEKVSEGAS
jgi:hypothetical protein